MMLQVHSDGLVRIASMLPSGLMRCVALHVTLTAAIFSAVMLQVHFDGLF
jgi:hypothetical protein